MLPVVNDIGELYNTADGGAMATLIAKLAIEKSYQSKLEETRNAIQVLLFKILFLASSSSSFWCKNLVEGLTKDSGMAACFLHR